MLSVFTQSPTRGLAARSIPALAALSLASVVSVASAQTIIVEPDDFPFGTDISTAFAGVTLSARGTAPNEQPTPERVFSYGTGGSATPTGRRRFGWNRQGPFAVASRDTWGTSFEGTSILRADFDLPATFVSIDFGGNLGSANSPPPADSELGQLVAFDAAGVQVGRATVSGLFLGGPPATVSISSPAGEIAFIEATGLPDPSIGRNLYTIPIDNLRVTPIPEPATAGLTALGGLLLLRRCR